MLQGAGAPAPMTHWRWRNGNTAAASLSSGENVQVPMIRDLAHVVDRGSEFKSKINPETPFMIPSRLPLTLPLLPTNVTGNVLAH